MKDIHHTKKLKTLLTIPKKYVKKSKLAFDLRSHYHKTKAGFVENSIAPPPPGVQMKLLCQS